MEDITLERLQNEFDEAISQIDDIVARKDIDAARQVLEQVAELVSNEEHIPLDDVEGYDHILHKLLDNIHGVIEIAEVVPEDPRLQALIREREEIDIRIREIDEELETLRNTDGEVTINITERRYLITNIKTRITRLTKSLDNPNLSEEEITRINEEITELEAYLKEILEIQFTRNEADTTEIDAEIAEKEKEIEELEKRIAELGDDDGRGTTGNGEGYSQEVIDMANEINNLRAQIAMYDVDIEAYEERFPSVDEMDTQENNENMRNREEAQRKLDELLERLREVSPEAWEIVSAGGTLPTRDENQNQARIDELNVEIDDLQAQMRQAAVARQRAREDGNEQEEAYASSEYNRLVILINERIKERDSLIASTLSTNNQERIDEINKRLQELETEIEALTNEINSLETLDRFFTENTIVVEEGEIVVGDGVEAEGLPMDAQVDTIIKEFEKEHNIKLDRSMYDVVWSGASGDVERDNDFTDEVGTPFKVVIHMDKVREKIEELKRQLDEKNKEKADLEKERDDLQNGKGGRGGNGGGSRNTSDEKKKLEEELARKKKELSNLKRRRASMIKNGDRTSIRIERESYIRMLEIRIEYLKMRLRTAEQKGDKRSIKKLTQEINMYELKIQDIRIGRTDNSERISELLSEKEKLITRRKEIDIEIQEIKGQKGITGDKLDLEEEAHKIGDKIFKTAEIRKELESRGYTREDFLSFYEQGRERTHQRIVEMNAEVDKITQDMIKEMQDILHDDETGVGLHQQLEAAGDNETERFKVLEKMRKNFISSGREQMLVDAGITGEITTKEMADKLEALWNGRTTQYEAVLQGKREEISEHEENMKVFKREIERIHHEMAAIKLAEGGTEELIERGEEEKKLRERQLRASMHGDPDLEKEWDERARRFISHKKPDGKKITYKNADGQEVEVNVDTVEDYEQLEDDAYFLNISEYKKYLEMTSLYDKAGLDAVKAVMDMSGPEFDEYHSLAQTDQAKADEWLEHMVAEKKEYVKTHNGFTNFHEVRAAVWRTAGSTLEQMLPVTGDLPTQTKLKNAAINTGRFFMLRMPKFSRIDSDGNKVPNVLGGVVTTAADAAVIGGVAAAAITAGPVGLIPLGVYYGAKGIVTIGNVVRGRIERNRYKDEIESNLPTLGHATERDREVARREFYRDKEHYSGVRSWFRAKLDKYILRDRAAKTEEKIIQRQKAAVDATIDGHTTNVSENVRRAEENQAIREKRTRDEVMSAGTYNDLVRDPDSADKEQVAAIAAQNAAVRAERPDAKRADVNPTSTVQRKDKYEKSDVEYEKTQDLEKMRSKGATASVATFTMAQKYQARKEIQDAINRVTTMILTAAGNAAVSFIRGKLWGTRDKEVPDPDATKEVKRQEHYTDKETREVPVTKKVKVKEVDDSKGIGDLKYDPKNYDNTYGIGPNGTVGKNGDIDAFVVRWKSPDGVEREWSISEAWTHIKAGHHVHSSTNADISNMSLEDLLKELAKSDPTGYKNFTSDQGLTGKSFEDIAKYLLEHKGGTRMFGQTSKMEGWSEIVGGGLKESTVEKVVGSKTVTEMVDKVREVVDVVPDPDATKIIQESFLDPWLAVKAVRDGAILGAAATGIEAIQEAAQGTYHKNPGQLHKLTPRLAVSRIADAAIDKYDREHGIGKYARQGKEEKPEEKKGKPEEKKDDSGEKDSGDDERE